MLEASRRFLGIAVVALGGFLLAGFLLAMSPVHDEADLMPASIEVFTDSAGNVLAAVDLDFAEPPRAERVFVLEREDEPYVFVRESFERGKILIKDRVVILVPDSGSRAFVLALRPEADEALPAERYQALARSLSAEGDALEVEILQGYGLARYRGSFATELRPHRLSQESAPGLRTLPAPVFQQNPNPPGDDGGTCKAGGVGSVSCSVGCSDDPCEVTCTPPRFACCNCEDGVSSCSCEIL